MTYFDWHESLDRATELVAELEKRGVAAAPWAEPNGLPSAQIFLTDERGEYAPALMMATEGTMQIGPEQRRIEAVEWSGVLYNFGVEMYDASVRMNERPHLGHGVAEIAEELSRFVQVLKMGAPAFHAANPVDE